MFKELIADEKNIITVMSVQGRTCTILLENRRDLTSDYHKYGLYDNGVRKFGLRKMRRGTQDESFVNNMLRSYETDLLKVKRFQR